MVNFLLFLSVMVMDELFWVVVWKWMLSEYWMLWWWKVCFRFLFRVMFLFGMRCGSVLMIVILVLKDCYMLVNLMLIMLLLRMSMCLGMIFRVRVCLFVRICLLILSFGSE